VDFKEIDRQIAKYKIIWNAVCVFVLLVWAGVFIYLLIGR